MNVNLWFARDEQNEIVGIYNANKDNKYHCPICNSDVIPKALESRKVSPHYAHVDVSKCNSESMLHWWFKHKFIDIGDTFTIITDKELNYTCVDFDVEVTFNLESGAYNPDLVVHTECGETVVFEMANTNKKQVKDYIDKWIELDKVVVEVDIKSLINKDSDIKKFNALYYKGKCFNFNRRDSGYYNIVGKLKEEMKRNGEYNIELVRKLDWFWNEFMKYLENRDSTNLYHILPEIAANEDYLKVVTKIIKKHKLNDVYAGFKTYFNNKMKQSYCHIEPNYDVELRFSSNWTEEWISNICNCTITFKDDRGGSFHKEKNTLFKIDTDYKQIERMILSRIKERNEHLYFVELDNKIRKEANERVNHLHELK